MKKLLVTLIALGFSSVAMAGIGTSGAPHNFYDNQCGNSATNYWSFGVCSGTNERTWNDSGEICKVCHIPHRDAAVDTATEWDKGALWNHKVTSTPFTPYDTSKLHGTVTLDGSNIPTGSSKLCLSCHDGVTGVDAFDADIAAAGANITALGSNMYGPGANVVIGTNLTQHHPVSVTYEATNAAAQLHATSSNMGPGTIATYLESDKLECGTCHDPHGDRADSSPNSLLRVINSALKSDNMADASKLCLTCHNK